jgi:hypothetical protein
VFALGPDGRVADSCRALDAIRVIHDLESLFQNLPERVTASERELCRPKRSRSGWEAQTRSHTDTVRLEAHADTNPIRPAEQRYVQEHGSVAYDQKHEDELADQPSFHAQQ